MSYQRITVSVIVADEDVESIKREFNQTLDVLNEDYKLHQELVEAEECEDPEDEDLYEYDDAA